ncbi:hypothetical protein M434DRAFT_300586 [Hypoxylon sp. CO27-5]|nr:hypothetical protein M434DRAFT_300586 [Hypoxylon sp. CO27-5]
MGYPQPLLKGLKATPRNEPDSAVSLVNLAATRNHRFRKTGAVSDLEDSIRITYRALSMAPNDEIRAAALTNLGVQLNQRYVLKTSPADLDERVRVSMESVKLTPKDSSWRSSRLNDLAASLIERYMKRSSKVDLEKAIQYQEEAIFEAHPTNQSEEAKVGFRRNLRGFLRERYKAYGALTDLEQSISIWRRVAEATPTDSVHWADYWSDVAESLLERYRRVKLKEDLEESVKISKQVVKADSDRGYPNHFSLFLLSETLGTQAMETNSAEALDECIQALRDSLKLVENDMTQKYDLPRRVPRYSILCRLAFTIVCIRICLRLLNSNNPSPFRLSFPPNLPKTSEDILSQRRIKC